MLLVGGEVRRVPVDPALATGRRHRLVVHRERADRPGWSRSGSIQLGPTSSRGHSATQKVRCDKASTRRCDQATSLAKDAGPGAEAHPCRLGQRRGASSEGKGAVRVEAALEHIGQLGGREGRGDGQPGSLQAPALEAELFEEHIICGGAGVRVGVASPAHPAVGDGDGDQHLVAVGAGRRMGEKMVIASDDLGSTIALLFEPPLVGLEGGERRRLRPPQGRHRSPLPAEAAQHVPPAGHEPFLVAPVRQRKPVPVHPHRPRDGARLPVGHDTHAGEALRPPNPPGRHRRP